MDLNLNFGAASAAPSQKIETEQTDYKTVLTISGVVLVVLILSIVAITKFKK